MSFITQGKTNWKFLLIVVILATIVGGGAIYCQYKLVECNSPADCEGKTHIMCVGQWECINNQCSWNCQIKEEQLKGETADWQTYRNEEYGFEIKYPSNWPSIAGHISITEKEKFKNDYENCLIEKNEETCYRMFGGDYDDLLKRIELVKDVQDESLTHDKTSHCFEGSGPCEPIRGFNFDCHAIGGYVKLRTIYNENLNMNLVRTIGYCGYDADIQNYYYWTPIVINENLIEIRFKLFPLGIFDDVNQLYTELGYKRTESGVWSCGVTCYQKELEYLENIDLDSDLVKGIIETYDRITESIKTF